MPAGLTLSLNAGAGGLVAFIVFLVLTGRLVTRKTADQFLALLKVSRDEALERERNLRSANEKLQETVRLQQGQIDELIEQGRTTVALLESLEAAARSPGRHAT